MAGNQFTTGGDVADGVLSQSGFSTTYTTEHYPLGTIRVEQADGFASGVADGTAISAGTGNSAVDRDVNFALLGGDRTWMFVNAREDVLAGQLVKIDFTESDTSTTACYPFYVEPSDSAGKAVRYLAGVADNDIDAGEYGWVVVKGACVILGTGTIDFSDLVKTHATEGSVQKSVGSDTEFCFGYSLETKGATLAGYVQCVINL